MDPGCQATSLLSPWPRRYCPPGHVVTVPYDNKNHVIPVLLSSAPDHHKFVAAAIRLNHVWKHVVPRISSHSVYINCKEVSEDDLELQHDLSEEPGFASISFALFFVFEKLRAQSFSFVIASVHRIRTSPQLGFEFPRNNLAAKRLQNVVSLNKCIESWFELLFCTPLVAPRF